MPPLIISGWVKEDKEFIEILKHYEETNAFGKDYSKDNPVWQEISARANLTAVYCRKKWLEIKYKYMKLRHMIGIGRVTELSVRMNKKTAKYVNGRLDFLDRFLSEIPDKALPRSVHQFFASLFGEESDKSTHSVDAVKLIKRKKNSSVIQVIQDYNQKSETEPTCILPNTEQAIEEEFSNNGDSDDVELVIPVHQVILPTIQLHQDDSIGDMANFQYLTCSDMQPTTNDPIADISNFQYVTSSSILPTTNDPVGDMANFQYITTSSIQPTTNDPIGDITNFKYVNIRPKINEEPNLKRKSGKPTKNEEPNLKRKSGNGNLAQFLIKYTNTNTETEQTGDLKQYMDDLAEVLCNRLAPHKRKSFLSEIDLIVSEMLEG